MKKYKRKTTKTDAEKIAREHLESLGLSKEIANRTIEVIPNRTGFTVIFSPKAGMRAGAFTITVDNNGKILSERYER